VIYGLDPGPERSALVGLDAGRVVLSRWGPNAAILALLCGELSPDAALAIEQIESFGMAVGREVFETVRWAGRFEQAWTARGGAVCLVPRSAVKLELCRSRRARDSNIRTALLDRFGPGRQTAIGTRKVPGPLYGVSGDQWSALAVAITFAATSDSRDKHA
jgi:hypothetical protein